MREALKPKNIRLCLCELFSAAVRCGSAKRWYEMRRDIAATHFCSFFLVILQLLCVRKISLEPKQTFAYRDDVGSWKLQSKARTWICLQLLQCLQGTCHFTRNLPTKALCKALWRLSISFHATRKMR